ncbi:MAG: ABC transporter substrate-binding protein [Gammaproteobacteria bacterium]|jgi:putative ABC transport system substrate-binding protein|nr:ABC transporter substrate-binding protein [Gammaproteobacteria bacterium]
MVIDHWSKITRLVVLVAAVTVSLAATGQTGKSDKVYRIGFLAFGPRPVGTVITSPLVAFRQTLRERGYVEGENLILDERWAEAHLDRLPALAAELFRLNPDILVASGASAVRAAMRETQEIPIIIAGTPDPVGERLVQSLARPGANVTGVSTLPGREFEGKRLQLLQQTIPGITRVAVILDSTSRLDPAVLESAAKVLGLTLLFSAETESPDEFRNTFEQMVKDHAEAVYAPETPVNVRQRKLLVELALEHRLPAMYASREYVEAGGLMSYGPNFSELFGRAAIYADKILKGATPGELPVEQPMHLELVINTRVARLLEISFPTVILMGADAVVQ